MGIIYIILRVTFEIKLAEISKLTKFLNPDISSGKKLNLFPYNFSYYFVKSLFFSYIILNKYFL